MGTAVGTALANRVGSRHRRRGRRSDGGECRGVRAAGARHVRRSLHASRSRSRMPHARNPRWVPAISSVSSASIGAHISTHGACEAARVIFRFGLWPAALELWGIAKTDPRAGQWDKRNGNGTPADHARSGAVRARGARGESACARRCHRRDGARLQSLGMVERILRDRRARPGLPTSTPLRCDRAPALSCGSIAPTSSSRRR